jgi:hypothetical protein
MDFLVKNRSGSGCCVFAEPERGASIMKNQGSLFVKEKKKGLAGLLPRVWQGKLLLIFLTGVILMNSACNFFGGETPEQAEPYQLSQEQSDLLQEKGYPEAFILLFYDEEAPDGSLQGVRQEIWEYYNDEESYTFINGQLTGVEELPSLVVGTLAPLSYVPEQFSANMSRDDVLAAAGVDDFIEVPLEKEYLEKGDLYYAESLAFGLVDGELRYLEALALTEE